MLLNTEDFLTIDDLAGLKGVGRRAVHNWVKQGIAPTSHRILGRLFFVKDDAIAFVPPKRGRRPDNALPRRPTVI